MDCLVLIDGHAILHRAFHALPSLTTSKGQPIGAVFGFCSMLLRVIKDLKPKYLAVAFDRPAPTFRQELFPAYQAQRPEMADELLDQIELVHRVLETMKVAIFEMDGYEADDVMGTLAMKATARIEGRKLKVGAEDRRLKIERRKIHPPSSIFNAPSSSFYHPSSSLEVIIVTGDRDMLQLVGENVKVLAPVTGITNMVLYDEAKVKERYGLKPSQWVDFKALVGDPSDNYPGVMGIGPKTAASLLNKYGSLGRIYQNLEELPGKLVQAIKEGQENVSLAKKLAQIVTDAPISLNLEKCRLQDLNNPKVEELFKEFEFKSLWDRITGNSSSQEKPAKRQAKKNGEKQLKLI